MGGTGFPSTNTERYDGITNEFDKAAGKVLEFFPFVVLVVATVGAQMSFSVVLSDLQDPTATDNDKSFVRRLVAASWLLFLVVTFCAFAAGALDILHGDSVRSGMLRKRSFVRFMGILAVLGVEIITFAAFACMAAAVREYDKELGQAAVGIVVLGALLTCAATVVYTWRLIRKS